MTNEQHPAAPEPTPSDEAGEAGLLRIKETGARFIGACALGTAAVILSAELSKAGIPSPDLPGSVTAEGVFVALGTYCLSLASKFGRKADVIDGILYQKPAQTTSPDSRG